MRYAVIGDIHGRSLEEFRAEIDLEELDGLICTGDFDTPETVHEIMDIREEMDQKEFIQVIGNHDEALFQDWEISSGTMYHSGLTSHRVKSSFSRDIEALTYLFENRNDYVKDTVIDGLNTVVVHGGLEGHMRGFSGSEDYEEIWNRLWYEEDYEHNLDAMVAQNYDLMFRGHDHDREYVTRNGETEITYPDPGDTVQLDDDSRHIVTHGAWHEGDYVTLDSRELEFHNVDQ